MRITLSFPILLGLTHRYTHHGCVHGFKSIQR